MEEIDFLLCLVLLPAAAALQAASGARLRWFVNTLILATAAHLAAAIVAGPIAGAVTVPAVGLPLIFAARRSASSIHL